MVRLQEVAAFEHKCLRSVGKFLHHHLTHRNPFSRQSGFQFVDTILDFCQPHGNSGTNSVHYRRGGRKIDCEMSHQIVLA